jgi:hypothetical protein
VTGRPFAVTRPEALAAGFVPADFLNVNIAAG